MEFYVNTPFSFRLSRTLFGIINQARVTNIKDIDLSFLHAFKDRYKTKIISVGFQVLREQKTNFANSPTNYVKYRGDYNETW